GRTGPRVRPGVAARGAQQVSESDYTTVRELYERFAGLDAAEIARRLEDENVSAGVREQVMRLFAAARSTSGDPVSGCIAGVANAAIMAPPPEHIGPYRILDRKSVV